MIPINTRTLKEQEDSRLKIIKESDIRMQPMSLNDYCPHIMESFMIKNVDPHDSHNYLGVQPDQYFYDHALSLKNNWYIGNNNPYQDFYNCRIKREEEDEQKLWPSAPIKDQQSVSANHEHGFQACQFPKQQQFQYIPRFSFEDPNKFLDPCISSTKEEKNIKRKLKVQAYLKKKKMRSFQKKIIYKCRKQVADNRIRYRGRFISINQAALILKLDPKQHHNPVQLMQKLKSHNSAQLQKEQKQAKQEIEQKMKMKKIQSNVVNENRVGEQVRQKLSKMEEDQ